MLVTCYVSVSFAGLQAEEGEGLEAGAVPAQVAARGGVVVVSGAVEDAGDGVGDRGEQPGGLPGAQPGGVFAEGGVAPVVQAVFYCPVVAVAGEQERRAGLGGGEGGDARTVSHETFAPQEAAHASASWSPGSPLVQAAGAPPRGRSCR